MLNPTSRDLLRAAIATMEELILPQLEGPHARSAAKNINLLLTHVIHRLEHEGPSLAEDNTEKRAVLSALTDRIGATELRTRLDAIPAAGSYVTIEDLASEAGQLRQLAIDASLHVHRACEERAAVVLAPLRAQLRAQLDRDVAAVSHLTPADIYDHKGV